MFLIEPTTAIGLIDVAWQQREKIAPLLRKLRYRLKHGRLRIVVFGSGGTGKTTLAEYLSGQRSPGTGTTTYKMSAGNVHFPMQGNLVATLLVPPGQERRRITDWPDLYRSLEEGKSGGVINVVSYGYHSFNELSYRETSYTSAKGTPKQFLAKYTEDRRKEELTVIKELVPRLSDAKRKIWMITLVTKQDLWWPERKGVREHYTDGEYNSYIEEISHNRGAQNFVHEYVSASLVISNFVSGAGELLKPIASGYDQNLQSANLQNLLNWIRAYSDRETR